MLAAPTSFHGVFACVYVITKNKHMRNTTQETYMDAIYHNRQDKTRLNARGVNHGISAEASVMTDAGVQGQGILARFREIVGNSLRAAGDLLSPPKTKSMTTTMRRTTRTAFIDRDNDFIRREQHTAVPAVTTTTLKRARETLSSRGEEEHVPAYMSGFSHVLYSPTLLKERTHRTGKPRTQPWTTTAHMNVQQRMRMMRVFPTVTPLPPLSGTNAMATHTRANAMGTTNVRLYQTRSDDTNNDMMTKMQCLRGGGHNTDDDEDDGYETTYKRFRTQLGGGEGGGGGPTAPRDETPLLLRDVAAHPQRVQLAQPSSSITFHRSNEVVAGIDLERYRRLLERRAPDEYERTAMRRTIEGGGGGGRRRFMNDNARSVTDMSASDVANTSNAELRELSERTKNLQKEVQATLDAFGRASLSGSDGVAEKGNVRDSVHEHDERLRREIEEYKSRYERLLSLRMQREMHLEKEEEEEEEEEDPAFRPLTAEQEECVENAWNKHEDDSEVLVTIANAEIKRSDLLRLNRLNWLNDEVINAYMELLKQRNVRFLEKGEQERMHFFNTFFYARLTSGGYNYNSVRRWTMQKRIGYSLSECAKVCFGS